MLRLRYCLAVALLAACFDLGPLQQPPPKPPPAGADLASELPTEPSLCANGFGFQLGGGKWACPGLFSTGGFGSLCAAPAEPCTSAAGIDLAKCDGLSGFFAANVGSYATGPVCKMIDPQNLTCADKPGETRYFLRYGCGSPTMDAGNVRKNCDIACGGFNTMAVCQMAGGYRCQKYDPGIDLNESESSGILCCAV